MGVGRILVEGIGVASHGVLLSLVDSGMKCCVVGNNINIVKTFDGDTKFRVSNKI